MSVAPEKPPREGKGAGRRIRRKSSLTSHGEPMVWLTGASLALCLVMISGLLGLVVYQGGRTFWPQEIVQVETLTGDVLMGQVSRVDTFTPSADALDALPDEARVRVEADMRANEGSVARRMLRTENFDLTGTHFDWIEESVIAAETKPEWAVVVERTAKGRFYGVPQAFLVDGEAHTVGSAATWGKFEEHHARILARVEQIHDLERDDLGHINSRIERQRLALREVELARGMESPEWIAKERETRALVEDAEREFVTITDEIGRLRTINDSFALRFETAGGGTAIVSLANIVRGTPVNRIGTAGKWSVYFDRWWEFLTADPREANSEGGVWPALFGTVMMTLLMTIVVVPIGVLAALYLHEYAKQGFLVGVVRVAVNNLAGVPSIVFGVFGLGFFCYIVGATIDDLFFGARLPNPTFGKGGILWASLTLALLTLPVVIVATEEALSAVPNSMREGSYACGATKWQTIWRIVLPRAQPGIMTGAILSIARGAGEVAPLMLVGAVKLAPDLPVDLGTFPYLFPERSFMHLGFHIYDVGFQSQNSEAAKPMVYTTTLLLIAIVVLLNFVAIAIRARLRRRFLGART